MARWTKMASIAALVAAASIGAGAQGQQAPTADPVRPSTSPSAPQPEQAGATFRSAVDLVSVAAVVRDRKGRFVSDLSRQDFTVVEAGQSRPIIGFRAEDDGPVRLAIVFDVSGSMQVGSKAADARQAARQLLGSLGPNDQAALFSFDTRLACVRQFTSDFGSLLSALDDVDAPYGQTSLYDAVAETARAVLAPKPGGSAGAAIAQRTAIVVLTDGVDTHSRLKPAQVSGIASGIDVPVYVMAVMSSIDDPRMFENPTAAPAGGLTDLARWTGGELFTMSAPAHVSVSARQIVGELRHQYLLAFEASASSGWRSLEVKARSRGLTVRARSGYTAGSRSSVAVSDASMSRAVSVNDR